MEARIVEAPGEPAYGRGQLPPPAGTPVDPPVGLRGAGDLQGDEEALPGPEESPPLAERHRLGGRDPRLAHRREPAPLVAGGPRPEPPAVALEVDALPA